LELISDFKHGPLLPDLQSFPVPVAPG